MDDSSRQCNSIPPHRSGEERPVQQPVGLAIAHPGHELRLTKWISQAKPAVCVLTTGARSSATSDRADASKRAVAELGGVTGEVFGRHLDREVYGWIMAGDPRPLLRLADELADSFVRRGLRTVVTDGWQLYNAVHDLWHLTVRVAVSLAEQRLQRTIDCLDFQPVPDAMSARASGPARLLVELTDEELVDKIRLAEAFPEIGDDVAEVVATGGRSFLRSEVLSAVRPLGELVPRPGEKPLYETYGEQRVATGRYAEVLRWRHVEPVVAALAAVLGSEKVAA